MVSCSIYVKGPQNIKDNRILGTNFDAREVLDQRGRKIKYYVSFRKVKKLPVALIIQGSGCWSVFSKSKNGQIKSWRQETLIKLTDKMHVLIVEKPGVKFLDDPIQPGTSINCSEMFKEEHTLQRWTMALNAALNDVLKSELAKKKGKTLVIGHSEGAITAASVASKNSNVTHVALLSGNGPNQLFDLAEIAREESRDLKYSEREVKVNEIFSTWKKIEKKPQSVKLMAWGHPYRRWHSFLSTSSLGLLLQTNAKIYLAHGTNDRSTPIVSFDLLRAELIVKNKDLEVERIENGSHSLNGPGQKSPNGISSVLINVINWFLL